MQELLEIFILTGSVIFGAVCALFIEQIFENFIKREKNFIINIIILCFFVLASGFLSAYFQLESFKFHQEPQKQDVNMSFTYYNKINLLEKEIMKINIEEMKSEYSK